MDTLVFVISQLAKPFFRIENLFVIIIFTTFFSLIRKWQKTLVISIRIALALAVLVTYTAPAQFLVSRLENKYEQPTRSSLDTAGGVIVLGGALVEGQVPFERKQIVINENGERLTTALQVLKQNQKWKLLYSTGSGQLLVNGVSEFDAARQFFQQQKIDSNRLIFESTSRSTYENANRSFKLINPKKTPWILITSATHMNRAVRTFKEAGWSVIPYPVDFQTGTSINYKQFSPGKGIQLWNRWIHENVASILYEVRFQLD